MAKDWSDFGTIEASNQGDWSKFGDIEQPAKPKAKEPSLIDAIKNAGQSVLDSLNPNSSVMDRIEPSTGRENKGVAISSGLGPMRQDFVDNTSAALRKNTALDNRNIAQQDGQVAKVAGLVANQQERRAGGDTLPRDRQDIFADIEEGSLPPDTRGSIDRAYDAALELGNAAKTGLLEAGHGLRATYNAYTDSDNKDLAASLHGSMAAGKGYLTTKDDKVAMEKWNAIKADGLGDFIQKFPEYVSVAGEHPFATLKLAARSAPNALVTIPVQAAGTLAGMMSPVPGGAAAGSVASSIAANTAIETGAELRSELMKATKGQAENMSEDEVRAYLDANPDIVSNAKKRGAIRGAAIGTIEGAGFLGAGRMVSAPARAAERAAMVALKDAGVDVASKQAVRASMADPIMRKLAGDAAEAASASFTKTGAAARWAGASGIETAAAGLGEAGAQNAVGDKFSGADVFHEMMGDAVMSGGHTAASKAAQTAGLSFGGKKAENQPPAQQTQPAGQPPAQQTQPAGQTIADIDAEINATDPDDFERIDALMALREGAEAAQQKPAGEAPSSQQPTAMSSAESSTVATTTPVRTLSDGTPVVGGRSLLSVPSGQIDQYLANASTADERLAIAVEMQRRGLPVPMDVLTSPLPGAQPQEQAQPVSGRENAGVQQAATPVEQPSSGDTQAAGQERFASVEELARSLQNRNRDSDASIAQMNAIANKPNPRLLMASPTMGDGAPVATDLHGTAQSLIDSGRAVLGDEDVVVTGKREIPVRYAVIEASDLSPSNFANGGRNQGYVTDQGKIVAINNGRTAGVIEAYARGTAGKYREAIITGQRAHGIPAEKIAGMKEPVLVRIMDRADVTRDIGDESNTNRTLGLSATEQARNDAARFDVAGVDYLENGSPTDSALRGFIAAMPASEQQQLAPDGQPTAQAKDRLMAAMFHAAYEDEELVNLVAQATDPEAKSILTGLSRAAAAMAKLKNAGDLDIRGIVTVAVQKLVNATRSGLSMKEFLRQADMLDGSAEHEVALVLAANARSSKRIGEILTEAAEFAYTESQKEGVDMFGEQIPRATRDDVIRRITDGNYTGGAENLGQQGGRGTNEGNAGPEAAGREGQGDAGGAQANQPGAKYDADFALESYAKQDIKEREARVKAAEKEAAKLQAELERKEKADRERSSFRLTGSDRPADDPAQGSLFQRARKYDTQTIDMFASLLPAATGSRPHADAAASTESARLGATAGALLRGGRGSLLGLAFAADWIVGRGSALVGKTVTSPADLATLAATLRDPRIETFRYFLVKDSKIVYHTAVSSRLYDSTDFAIGDQAKFLDGIKETMTRLGADGYYIMHNHPSRTMVASGGDIRATRHLANKLPGFLGHVVLDHNEFVLIDRNGDASVEKLAGTGDDPTRATDKPHPVLGAKINSPAAFADIANTVRSKDNVVLVSTDAQLGVVGVMEAPPGQFRKAGFDVLRTIGRLRKAAGSNIVFAVLPDSMSLTEIPRALLEKGWFIDAYGNMPGGGKTSASSANIPGVLAGQILRNRKRKGVAIDQPSATYGQGDLFADMAEAERLEIAKAGQKGSPQMSLFDMLDAGQEAMKKAESRPEAADSEQQQAIDRHKLPESAQNGEPEQAHAAKQPQTQNRPPAAEAQSNAAIRDFGEKVVADGKTVLFSRAPNGTKQSASKRAGLPPVSQSVIDGLVAGLPGVRQAAGDARITTLFSPSELPSEVLDQARTEGIPENEIHGVLFNGRAYIVRQNLKTRQDVEEVLLHEVMGHGGVRALLGGSRVGVLLESFNRAGGVAGLRQIAKAYGVLGALNQRIPKGALDNAQKVALVDELLALAQGKNQKLRQVALEWLGKIRNFIIAALDKAGLHETAARLDKFDATETAKMLREMRDAVVAGGDIGGHGVAFMIAWHGSPHDHDGFDSSKIGTGEGAQAYGFGHYFAGARAVAEWYRDKLTSSGYSLRGKKGYEHSTEEINAVIKIGRLLAQGSTESMAINLVKAEARRDVDNAKKLLDEQTQNIGKEVDLGAGWGDLRYQTITQADVDAAAYGYESAKRRLEVIEGIKPGDVARNKGRLYQVELAPAGDELLDWDRPLSEQSEKVKAALQTKADSFDGATFRGRPSNNGTEAFLFADAIHDARLVGGGDFYKTLTRKLASDKAASEYLHSIGIRGIKYLDGNSRGANEGSHNYVIFDDADIEITAKFSRSSSTKAAYESRIDALFAGGNDGEMRQRAEQAAVNAAKNDFWERKRVDAIRTELYEEYHDHGTVDGREVSQEGIEFDDDGDITDDGFKELDRRVELAIDKATKERAGHIDSLEDIDRLGTHMQAYDAAMAWLDTMGLPYQDVRSAGSRYLEIHNPKDIADDDDLPTLKLRFSTHVQQSRSHSTTDLNWVVGREGEPLADMLNAAMLFSQGETGLGEKFHFSQSADVRTGRQSRIDDPLASGKASKIRAAIQKAYGKLLERLEAKGLVTLVQSVEDAVEAAAQARAKVTGERVEDVKRSLMASVKNQAAWHGTPYRGIEQTGFKLNKIGTGEGAQAYGWGHYFAGAREVAEGYRTRLTGRINDSVLFLGERYNGKSPSDMMAFAKAVQQDAMLSDSAREMLYLLAIKHKGDMTAVGDEIGERLIVGEDEAAPPAAVNELYEWFGSSDDQLNPPDGGQLYSANIPEDSDLLDWDKPLSEQPEKVRDALKPVTRQMGGWNHGGITYPVTNVLSGSGLYGALEREMGGPQAASEYLQSIGIPGLRYLDGNSRSAGEGSHNYVIWDEALLTPEAAQIEPHYSKNGDIEGFFDPVSGQSFLVADALTEETAPGTLMHEVGIHMAAEKDGAMQKLITRAGKLRQKWANNKFVQEAEARMREAGETSDEEFLAYTVTQYEDNRARMPVTLVSLAKDFIAAVKAWLFKKGYLQASKLTVADLAAIARANARKMARGPVNHGGGGGARRSVVQSKEAREFSATERAYGGREAYDRAKAAGKTKLNYRQWVQVRTKHFKAWFGDWENDPANASKVIDPETGEPMVVYHGTASDFTEFSGDKVNYFTAWRDAAGAYAEGFGAPRNGAHVVPSFVKVANPKALPLSESAKLTTEDIARLKSEGFDGVFGTQTEYIWGDKPAVAILPDGRRVTEVVPFLPTQIKSATGNTGAFDGANSDIRFSRQGQTGGIGRATAPQRPAAPPPVNPWQRANAKAKAILSPENIDRVIYEMQDKFIDLKRLRDHIKAIGGVITDLNDAYLGEELYHQRLAKRVKNFQENEIKPLLADMRKRGVRAEEFETFLHARHAPEANAEMAKRNPNQQEIDAGRRQAAAAVKTLERQLQGAKARGVATKSIKNALNDARGELANWNKAQAFQGTEEERLSLSGMSDAEAQAIIAGLSPAKRAHLDALAVKVDAINSGTMDTLVKYGLMDQAAIDAWRKTYKYYIPLHRDEAHPDSTSHPIGQGFSTKGDASKRRTGSNEKVTHILGHIAMQREAALTRGEKNHVMRRLYLMAKQNPLRDVWETDKVPMIENIDKATGFVHRYPDPNYKNKPNVLMLRLGGKDVAIVVNEHNPEAMRMAAALKNLDVDDLHYIIPTVAKATRYFSSINTQYNPIFGVVNFTRDVQAALLQLSTTELAGRQAQVGRDTFAIMGHILKNKGRMPKSGQWGALFEEFQNVGGTTGYRDLFLTPEDRANALLKELKSLDRGNTKKAAHAVMDWLSDYNEAMENAVRLAAYKTGLDAGMSKERAASLAKNLTVNFNRKGRQAREIGALYAFFNAAVQGTTRMAQTLSGPAGKKIMAGGVTLGALSAVLGIALMGEGDDDEYAKIPEFVKERSLIIPISKDDYIAIPLPLGFHFLPNIGRLAVEMFHYKDKTVGKQVVALFTTMMDAFNPFGGNAPVLQMAAPTVMDPFLALAQNKDWTGKNIYMESFNKLDPQPGHQRTKDSATPWSKWFAEAINAVTGGTQYTAGGWSPTPDQIDYVIGQLTGGVGREIGKAATSLQSLATGDELPPHKIPLAGRFYGSTAGPSGQSDEFYENVIKANEHKRMIDGMAKDGESPAGYIKEHPGVLKMIGRAKAAESQVRKLRKISRERIKRNPDDAKAIRKKTTERISAIMKGLNLEARRAARE